MPLNCTPKNHSNGKFYGMDKLPQFFKNPFKQMRESRFRGMKLFISGELTSTRPREPLCL